MDAWGALNASFGNLWKATAEINESLFPHVQWSRDYRTDSGGPGQWRGICGSHYEKEVLVDAKVYTYVVGMKYPMPGICGGRNGAPNEMILRYGSDDPYRVGHTADWVPMQAGERIMYDYGGGGGWGDPLDRDPQAVLDDVLDEYVSVEGAAPRLRRRAHRLARRPHARGRRRGDRTRCAPRCARRRACADGLPGRGRRRRHVHRPHLRHARRARSCSTRRRRTLDDQSTGVMNGLGAARRALRPVARRVLRAARHPRARHHHRRQHDDRDERRRPPACSSPRATATRSSCAAATRKQIWDPNCAGPDPDRAPPGPHPDPRAHGLHRQGRARARRAGRCAAACSA